MVMIYPEPNANYRVRLTEDDIINANTSVFKYLKTLSEILEEEVGGYIVFKVFGEYHYPILAIYWKGNVGGVRSMRYLDVYNILQERLEGNDTLVVFPFHTHTYGTARVYGEYFLKGPSRQDIEYLRTSRLFSSGIIITPRHLIIFHDDGSFERFSWEIDKRFRIIKEEYLNVYIVYDPKLRRGI